MTQTKIFDPERMDTGSLIDLVETLREKQTETQGGSGS